MTAPIRFPKGRYTDNDEARRARARGIQKLGQSYESGSAYNDIDETQTTAEKLNAEKGYDMLSRVKPPAYKFKFRKPNEK